MGPTNIVYRLRTGEALPKVYYPHDSSGDWIALGAAGRRPWLAKLSSPLIVATELPESHRWIHVFANGQIVHVFSRKGFNHGDGPLEYLVYDFARGGSQPIRKLTLAWARTPLEMDAETGRVVITGNQRSWAPCWPMDINTGKQERIPWPDWHMIVKMEVAEKWLELTKS